MATPQVSPEIRGRVKEYGVVVKSLPEALNLLEQCTVQMVQALAIVQGMFGLPIRNTAPGSPRRIGPANAGVPAKRQFSKAAKERMSEGMRRFWAKRKAEAAKKAAGKKKSAVAKPKGKPSAKGQGRLPVKVVKSTQAPKPAPAPTNTSTASPADQSGT